MRKYDNFCAALRNLQAVYQYHEPFDIVTLTGLVSLFQICFEQAWKLMKEVLEYNGCAESATGSPRMILKTAYAAGMIQNETLWLEALQERNNENIAPGIVRRTREDFFEMFCALKQELDAHWL